MRRGCIEVRARSEVRFPCKFSGNSWNVNCYFRNVFACGWCESGAGPACSCYEGHFGGYKKSCETVEWSECQQVEESIPGCGRMCESAVIFKRSDDFRPRRSRGSPSTTKSENGRGNSGVVLVWLALAANRSLASVSPGRSAGPSLCSFSDIRSGRSWVLNTTRFGRKKKEVTMVCRPI
jgi:hypothetical protein